jgi:hypothetical protein
MKYIFVLFALVIIGCKKESIDSIPDLNCEGSDEVENFNTIAGVSLLYNSGNMFPNQSIVVRSQEVYDSLFPNGDYIYEEINYSLHSLILIMKTEAIEFDQLLSKYSICESNNEVNFRINYLLTNKKSISNYVEYTFYAVVPAISELITVNIITEEY